MTAKTSNTVKFVQPAAKRYARVLYELEIPKADIEKTKEIFCQVPEVYEVHVQSPGNYRTKETNTVLSNRYFQSLFVIS